MIRSTRAIWTGVAAAAGLLWSFSASATALHATALHAFCFSPTATCTDNGTVTPTTNPSPNFGFWYSSGPATGDFYVDILVPNNDPLPSSLTLTVTGGAISPAVANEFSTSGWTSKFLAAYLGISASPANPIGAWLPTTQGNDPGATGYYVFQADLGSNTLAGAAGSGPDLNAGTLDLGTVVVGFLETNSCNKNGDCEWVATANSGALYEGTSTVPEPGTLALFGAGLLGCALFIARRRAAPRS